MKQLRSLVPILGFFALMALFFMLPETPSAGCTTCASHDPYIPLFGAAYFSILIALSLLFPSFPGPYIARGGLIWSVLLASALSYIHLPDWCVLCLVGHVCNILIWTIWVMVPPVKNASHVSSSKEKLCLLLFAPFSVVALFSCLNLTFMAYGHRDLLGSSLQRGDAAPLFTTKTVQSRTIASADRMIINFVSSSCPYCKEQLQVLSTVVDKLNSHSYRVINISSEIPAEWVGRSSGMEWVEDKDGHLRKLFKVSGYPTLFVVESDGKIAQIISGVPEQFKWLVLSFLGRVPERVK